MDKRCLRDGGEGFGQQGTTLTLCGRMVSLLQIPTSWIDIFEQDPLSSSWTSICGDFFFSLERQVGFCYLEDKKSIFV